jgi:uncharacterized protein
MDRTTERIMLRHTFCHIQGIGPKTEQQLWTSGVHTWDDVIDERSTAALKKKAWLLRVRVAESLVAVNLRDARYFTDRLSASESWRIFSEFRDETAYLDIETGSSPDRMSHITAIALYDGKEVSTYVYGRNLDEFVSDIYRYKVLVTYNGKSFDVPCIENFFGVKLDHAHIDLRFVLASLGYKGGLKRCEKRLGLDREELDGVDGYAAVILWSDYVLNGNCKALETLLAYNVLDTVNLEALLVRAYNLKLAQTPFHELRRLPAPREVVNPFKADRSTLDKIRGYLAEGW